MQTSIGPRKVSLAREFVTPMETAGFCALNLLCCVSAFYGGQIDPGHFGDQKNMVATPKNHCLSPMQIRSKAVDHGFPL